MAKSHISHNDVTAFPTHAHRGCDPWEWESCQGRHEIRKRCAFNATVCFGGRGIAQGPARSWDGHVNGDSAGFAHMCFLCFAHIRVFAHTVFYTT